MMFFTVGLAIGLSLGACLGFLVAAILSVGKLSDRVVERMEARE